MTNQGRARSQYLCCSRGTAAAEKARLSSSQNSRRSARAGKAAKAVLAPFDARPFVGPFSIKGRRHSTLTAITSSKRADGGTLPKRIYPRIPALNECACDALRRIYIRESRKKFIFPKLMLPASCWPRTRTASATPRRSPLWNASGRAASCGLVRRLHHEPCSEDHRARHGTRSDDLY